MISSYLIRYNKGTGLNLAEKWILRAHFFPYEFSRISKKFWEKKKLL